MATAQTANIIDQQLNILIMNTEPSCAVVMGIILHLCGFGVQRATTATQAMEFLEKSTLDVILTDSVGSHPEWEAINQVIRSKPGRKHIPMVGVIHQPNSTSDRNHDAFRVDAMVSVPFTPKQFQDVLTPLL